MSIPNMGRFLKEYPLKPYPYWNTTTMNCHPDTYFNNFTFATQQSHRSNLSHATKNPVVTVKRFLEKFSDRVCAGHIAYINNPLQTFSILEPSGVGGCESKIRATVRQSAKQKKCLLAVNAGFFNATTEECYGNVVSDGRLIAKSKWNKNANFGIRKDGSLVFG